MYVCMLSGVVESANISCRLSIVKLLPDVLNREFRNIKTFFNIVWFYKMSIPTPRRVIGNSERRGRLKGKIFNGKYKAKLEIPEGGGGTNQKPSLGEYGYFLEQHIQEKNY